MHFGCGGLFFSPSFSKQMQEWGWKEASGKDPVTQKWYNQGLNFHNREIFKTDFWQITRGREDERNKDHFVSQSLHKSEENKMAGISGKLGRGRRWSNGDEWGLGWCKTPTRSLQNKSKLPTKQQNEELKVYWWNFLHPLVILTADKMAILFCQSLHIPFNILTEENLQWRGFSWK